MSDSTFAVFRFFHRALRGTGLGKIKALRMLRDALYRATKPGAPRLIEFPGFKLLVDPTTAGGVVQELLLDAVHEQAETDALRDLLRPGMKVIDVGANIGYDTILAASLVGPTGHVYAFEPERSNLESLRRNIELNGFGHVTVFPNACSDKVEVKKLFIDPANTGGHHFYDDPKDTGSQAVETVTVDSAIGDAGRRIDLVKMDIQGFEPYALRGMAGVIRANPGLVLITEFHPMMIKASGGSPEDFLLALRSFGFEIRPLLEWPAGEVANDPATLIAMCGDGDFINLFCTRAGA